MPGLINLKLLTDFFNKIGPSRTWRDVRPESEMRLLAVSINEYATLAAPRFAGAEANRSEVRRALAPMIKLPPMRAASLRLPAA